MSKEDVKKEENKEAAAPKAEGKAASKAEVKKPAPKAEAKPAPVEVKEAPKAVEKADPAPVEVKVEAPRPVSPAWDKETWMSLANVSLGVPPFVVAGALHGKSSNEQLTEADVRKHIQAFLSQSL